jgi:hypothetical protein
MGNFACMCICAFSLLVTTSGCAVHYYDAKTGTAHLWGIGHMKMRVVPAVDDSRVQAVAVGIQTIGLRLDANQHTSGINLGYDNSSFVYVVSSDTSLRIDTADNDPFTLRLGTQLQPWQHP